LNRETVPILPAVQRGGAVPGNGGNALPVPEPAKAMIGRIALWETKNSLMR
jgi:hypothetical protein